MITLDNFTYWISGFLFLLSILQLWFSSPLKITLGEILFKEKLISETEFDDRLSVISDKLSMLSTCYTCFSFWTSLFIGIVLTALFDLPLYWPLITFFTYPPLAFAYKAYVFSKTK